MQVLKTIKEVRELTGRWRAEGMVGLVPTMGYFHEGHLELLRRAREASAFVWASIFVNPLQFGPREDFKDYPRDLERDLALAKKEGVDAVFYPDAAELYPPDFSTFVEVPGLSEDLCGRSRPGHFRGVTTVVAKLFNIIQPHQAFFGQKDAQQAIILQKMVRDLNFPVKIIVVPTVREADGLAMSSRNVYLKNEERRRALILGRSLEEARRCIEAGEREPQKVKEAVLAVLTAGPGVQVDYVEIRSAADLKELQRLEGTVLIALAVRIGAARLIDNIMLEV